MCWFSGGCFCCYVTFGGSSTLVDLVLCRHFKEFVFGFLLVLHVLAFLINNFGGVLQ